MAWIQSHQSLANHKKLLRLARELEITRVEAIGHLHLLWWWALDSASDGSLSDVTAEEIADIVQWRKDAKKFLNTLILCGFIDEDLSLHEWDTYGATYNKVKEASARRQRLRRKKLREASVTRDVTVTSRSQQGVTSPLRHCDVTVEKEEKEEKYRIPPLSPSGEGAEEEAQGTPVVAPLPPEPPVMVTREMARGWFDQIVAEGGRFTDDEFERAWLRKHSTRDRLTGAWTRGRSISHDPRADLMLSLRYEAKHRDGTTAANASSTAGGRSEPTWQKKQRLDAVRALMANHKGNPSGTWSEATREAHAEEWMALRAEEQTLVQSMSHEPQ